MLPPRIVAGPEPGGELSQGGVEHDHVVGGRVRPGLAWSQQLSDRFATTGATMIHKGQ